MSLTGPEADPKALVRRCQELHQHRQVQQAQSSSSVTRTINQQPQAPHQQPVTRSQFPLQSQAKHSLFVDAVAFPKPTPDSVAGVNVPVKMVVAIVLTFVPLPDIVVVLPAFVIVMVFVTVLVRFTRVIAIVTVLGVPGATVPSTLEMEFAPVTSRLVAVTVQVSVMYSVMQLGTPSPQLAGPTLTANNNANQHSLMESVMDSTAHFK
jgi:hypothetical protein